MALPSACSATALPTTIMGFLASLNFLAKHPYRQAGPEPPCIGADVVVLVSEVDLLADETDVEATVEVSLANTGVDDGSLVTGVGADEKKNISLLDTGMVVLKV